jgi:tRNA threonylcarbamoyladenosine biosynthesis protein TsaE
MIASKVWISAHPDETRSIAAGFANSLGGGSVIQLIGELGAGKTEFVKGLAAGLGYAGDVTSPTFTLVHEYRGGRLPLFHLDLYRLRTEAELDETGYDDYLRVGGICVVEWADRFPARMPSESTQVILTILENGQRRIAW